MINRRHFIGQVVGGITGAAAFTTGCKHTSQTPRQGVVQTVLGPIRPDLMGPTLTHEHVLVDFIGAAKINRGRYEVGEAFNTALPHLRRIAELGCRTLVECTPAYIGRDPNLLRRLASATGLNLLTNTGYYGAAKNKYLPEHAFSESVEQLASRWIGEAKEGIEGTGIRPGFIKTGVDAGQLSEVHAKLVRAAARAHWATGLTIAAHTGNGVAALEELDIIEKEGLKGEAFIWVHAQSEVNSDLHARAAERGAWVEFDGVGPKSIEQHVILVRTMRDRGFLHRVLLSHDAGWFHVGEPGGGQFRPFDTLFAEFLPALRENGFNEAEIDQLIVRNPQAAFTIQVRGR